jgi:putative flippase GtrA
LRRHGTEAFVMRTGIVDEFWRLVRFSAAGGLATVVHIGVAMVAVSVAGANPTVGAMIGFVAAFLVSYVGHFRFTFAVPGRFRDYLLKFALSSLASFCVSTGSVWMATAVLGIDYKPALIALAVIVPVCNYLVNRFRGFFELGVGRSRTLEGVTPD